MKVYGRVGESEQLVVADNVKNFKVPEDMVPMTGERPGPNYVAKEDGTWEEVPEEEATPAIEPGK